MIPRTTPDKTDFDDFSIDYDTALANGLSASGEGKDYFASGRIAWLVRCLGELGENPLAILDFGCGTGTAVPFILERIPARSIIGVDVSAKSLEVARRERSSEHAQFLLLGEYGPNAKMDLAFCNGVFHHIPLQERAEKVRYVYQSLRPGGLFSFWENNPWNPGTRYVMSRIPFDRDAITLSPPQARSLLREGGFEVLRSDFLFIFPRQLSWLRSLETYLVRLPLGGQYQILCRKPLSV